MIEPYKNQPAQDKHDKDAAKRRSRPLSLPIIAASLLFVLAMLGIGCVSFYLLKPDENPTPLQFFVTSALSASVLYAVMIQVIVNHGQWDAMQEQLDIMGVAFDPRLRINTVRVINMKVGRMPGFTVRIANDGATDARDVVISLRVEGDLGTGVIPVEWQRKQTVTIAAHNERVFDLQWGATLEQVHIDSLVRSLKVFVYLEHKTVQTPEFCFQYRHWMGKRPKEIEQFVPCDFNPSLAYIMNVRPAEIKLTPGTVDMVYSGKKDETSSDKTDEGEKPN